jgi:hypothetical protein
VCQENCIETIHLKTIKKGRKKDFGKVMGVFLRIIGPLAEAI